ncbi:MAG: thiamine diphosphokinase [Pararhodobacter sp.]
MTGITLLGGGELAPGQLERALGVAPELLAVDGGADRALAAGVMPKWVSGDFDSISEAARQVIDPARLHHTPDQDQTDFDKAVSLVEAPLLLAVGFTGARLDHTLAGISTLLRNPHRRLVLDAGIDLCFLAPPELRLALPAGTRFSLYPMARMACDSLGLVWATDGLILDPAGRLGTSNAVAEGGAVMVRPQAPAMLVMVPVATFAAVLAGLRRAPVWPAPARGQ